MANSRQIRAWAREQGLDVSDAGPISTDIRRSYREAHEEVTDSSPVSVMDDAMPVVEEVAPKIAEDEPVIARVITRAKKASRPSSGRRRATRNPVSHILGFVYGGLAAPVSKVSEPVAYMMSIQSDVAGQILDPVVAGTVLDKILQPFAKVNEKLEPVQALLMPLACVAVMERFPGMESDPKVVNMLRKSLASWAKIAKPHLDAIKAEEAQFEEEFGKDINEVIEMLQNVILVSRMKKEQAAAAESWG